MSVKDKHDFILNVRCFFVSTKNTDEHTSIYGQLAEPMLSKNVDENVIGVFAVFVNIMFPIHFPPKV